MLLLLQRLWSSAFLIIRGLSEQPQEVARKRIVLCFKAFHCVFLHIRVSSGDLHLQILAGDADWKSDSSPCPSRCPGNSVTVPSAQTGSISFSSFRKTISRPLPKMKIKRTINEDACSPVLCLLLAVSTSLCPLPQWVTGFVSIQSSELTSLQAPNSPNNE